MCAHGENQFKEMSHTNKESHLLKYKQYLSDASFTYVNENLVRSSLTLLLNCCVT
jgi:hypothetical protein